MISTINYVIVYLYSYYIIKWFIMAVNNYKLCEIYIFLGINYNKNIFFLNKFV